MVVPFDSQQLMQTPLIKSRASNTGHIWQYRYFGIQKINKINTDIPVLIPVLQRTECDQQEIVSRPNSTQELALAYWPTHKK